MASWNALSPTRNNLHWHAITIPNLDSTLDIATPSKLAWAFAPDVDAELLAEAEKFFTLIKQDGTLRRLLDRYYGHNERLESGDAVAFLTKTRTVLPHIRSLFEEAATLTGMEWQLFAALAYQESHWDPLATSPTNVRGMMMLTEDTADRMGVTNRLECTPEHYWRGKIPAVAERTTATTYQ